jgi:hypothetical protein
VKAHELRSKGKEELLKQLEELKGELAQLRVSKVFNLAQTILELTTSVCRSRAKEVHPSLPRCNIMPLSDNYFV